MTSNQTAELTHQSFSIAFFNALAEAMTEASGSPWLIAAVPDAESALDGAGPVRIKVRLDGSLDGELVLEFQGDQAAMLASKISHLPAGEDGSNQSEAMAKLTNESGRRLQRVLAQEFGSFGFNALLDAESTPDQRNCIQGTAGDDEGNRVSMRLYLNPALAETLARHAEATNSSSNEMPFMEPITHNTIPPGANLEMVMDLELNVTLRFGQRQLTLREVMELTSGSVVELDRQVDEPVELLLDGMLIAKGEAVVVDGNYGLRVTQVIRPVSTAMLARA